MNEEDLSPAQVLTATGVTRKALRVYEKHGLLTSPARTYNGRRRYAFRTVEEVRFIRAAIAAGLPLKDLKPALDDWRGGKSACPALTAVLDERIEAIDEQMRQLRAQRQRLGVIKQEWDCNCAANEGVCVQITRAGLN